MQDSAISQCAGGLSTRFLPADPYIVKKATLRIHNPHSYSASQDYPRLVLPRATISSPLICEFAARNTIYCSVHRTHISLQRFCSALMFANGAVVDWQYVSLPCTLDNCQDHWGYWHTLQTPCVPTAPHQYSISCLSCYQQESGINRPPTDITKHLSSTHRA